MNFAVALCHVLFLRNQEGVGRCPSWLKLPVKALKIDKAFVQGLAHDTNGQKIVRIILDLARSLHLETVAEGVEDGKTLALLGEWGWIMRKASLCTGRQRIRSNVKSLCHRPPDLSVRVDLKIVSKGVMSASPVTLRCDVTWPSPLRRFAPRRAASPSRLRCKNYGLPVPVQID
jgi:hypothetical protein